MEKEFIEYPFEVNGIQFVSRILKGSQYDESTKDVPREILDSFNKRAIHDLVGDPTEFDRAELEMKMAILNAFGTEAFLELV